jgi:hypothetical protein
VSVAREFVELVAGLRIRARDSRGTGTAGQRQDSARSRPSAALGLPMPRTLPRSSSMRTTSVVSAALDPLFHLGSILVPTHPNSGGAARSAPHHQPSESRVLTSSWISVRLAENGLLRRVDHRSLWGMPRAPECVLRSRRPFHISATSGSQPGLAAALLVNSMRDSSSRRENVAFVARSVPST